MPAFLDTLLARLARPAKDESVSEHDLQLATTALLVEVGRADFHWREEEIHAIIDILSKRFDLDENEARAVFEQAREQSDNAISMHPVIELINKHCSLEQKRQILLDCWRIAYSDNTLDRYEDHHIRKIADWLYLHHSDFIQTKLRAHAEAEKRQAKQQRAQSPAE